MKILHLGSKFTHSNIRTCLGLCFLSLALVSILSYSALSDHLSFLFYSFHLLISHENLFGISWTSLLILTLGYYPYMKFKQKHEKEKLRIKLASDLHDDLGSILNSVSIYTDLALIKGESTYLHKIKESTQEAISGVRNIIWQLDDKDTSFSNLISRINCFASFLCQAKQIRFKAEMGKEAFLYQLQEEEKRNLYMIIKEAINNSVKYSNAKEILLNIDLDKGKPVIIIKDDGKGCNEIPNVSGNGITNMKTRARCIRYQISIQSLAGTIIKLRKK